MPWVDLAAQDDFASLWYTTNSPHVNVGGFDPERSTVIILHPTFLDTRWLEFQFGDPRLDQDFNLIAFDMRVCGRSHSRPSGRHDGWVDAADIAFACQALYLPAAHVLAFDTVSVSCAARFAALFPDMCLSLTLVGVPAPTELKWISTAYDEMLSSWCYADDLDSFELVAKEAAMITAGKDCSDDLLDELVAYWEIETPPRRRRRLVESTYLVLNRTPLPKAAVSSITQPVLMIQGERCETSPVKYAERLSAELVNAEGDPIIYVVKGASGCLCINPDHASIVNQVFIKFVSRLPKVKSPIVPPLIPTLVRMKMALARLAEFTGDASLMTRDPRSSMSFSCLPSEVVQRQTEALIVFGRGEAKAFNPLSSEGVPLRKYSERGTHWFQGGQDGLSYVGSTQPAGNRSRVDITTDKKEKRHTLTNADSMPLEVIQENRLRRGVFKPSTVDKHVVKGSMAKVVATAPLQRINWV